LTSIRAISAASLTSKNRRKIMKTVNVLVGLGTEIVKELDNKVSVMLTRLELACRNHNEEIWKRIKSTVISLLLKSAVESLTDNSIVNAIADTVVAYNIFKDVLLVKKILNEAESFNEDKIKEELERLSAIEFDIEF
jgi:hypothetical protein